MEFQTGIDLKRNSRFSVTFKTTNPDGVLFYVSDKSHTDKIVLLMKDGRVSDLRQGFTYPSFAYILNIECWLCYISGIFVSYRSL
jgi:hypothetical protein